MKQKKYYPSRPSWYVFGKKESKHRNWNYNSNTVKKLNMKY